jgi:aminoglycoside phosphotransferase family enzyme/predicted kinase
VTDGLCTSAVPLRLFDASLPGIEIAETHVSALAFDRDVVHKRKKAVRFPFVDLTARAQRAALCRREVELNRRFAPDVYLGVEDIIDDRGAVVDHAVLMRRMPTDRRLAELIGHQRPVGACLRAVARSIAVHHAEAPSSAEISAVATPRALHELWAGNLTELDAFVPQLLDAPVVHRIGDLAHRYLDGRSDLLAERIERGWIVDGHGDLLADDIFCLDDGPRILDALEFDDRLRWGDVLYDVGFLAMDLHHLGRPDLAAAFVDWYSEFAGENHPPSLEHHYIAYRALVRAKVAALRDDAANARAYLALCLQQLLTARIQLVIVGGLPGTGKSTLAGALGDELGWTVLRTDEVRKQRAGVGPREHRPSSYGVGMYDRSTSDATYAAVFERAAALLSRGSSVIIDGSFSCRRWRADARALAVRASADLSELRCVLPTRAATARLAARGEDVSDADPAVAARMASDFERWPQADDIGTAPPVADLLGDVLQRLGRDT